MPKTLNINGLSEIITFHGNLGLKQSELLKIQTRGELLNIMEVSAVPDVYRYDLVFSENQWVLKPLDKRELPRSQFKDKKPIESNIHTKGIKTIVLVIESPHTDEYQYFDSSGKIIEDYRKNHSLIAKMIPIAPAQGTTGKNIEKYFLEMALPQIIQYLDSSFIYKIIISNPIQYQTSLFSLHGKALKRSYETIRNRVWGKIWDNKEIKENFKRRLTRYKPAIIINACTSGVVGSIKDFIDHNFENIDTVSTDHPANRERKLNMRNKSK